MARAVIGRRPGGRHLPRKSARIPGNGTEATDAPRPPPGELPFYLLPPPYFVYTAHTAPHTVGRLPDRSLARITTTGYSAAADRVGRQQRRGRGPDPGRRDRDSPAGPGPGPATPHHRLDKSIDPTQCHRRRAGQFASSGDSDVKCYQTHIPGLPIYVPSRI